VQPGRKSAAASVIKLAATDARPKLTAPSCLTKPERIHFDQLVRANRYLTITDQAMLASYVQAMSKSHRLGRGEDTEGWERATRVMMALARTLRLTAISSTHPDKLSRQRRDARPSVIDEILAGGDDE
jgi:hypothetical protein